MPDYISSQRSVSSGGLGDISLESLRIAPNEVLLADLNAAQEPEDDIEPPH